MDLSYIFNGSDIVLFISFLILFIMSITSWCILIIKLLRLAIAKSSNEKFLNSFWQSKNLNNAYELSLQNDSPIASIVKSSYESIKKYGKEINLHNNIGYDEYISRIIRHSMDIVLRPFSFGLNALATIGSTAPFIGLFGTVWGIYHALITISLNKQVSLAIVAQPIGESLIATAFGLFVAIPSVLFYNSLIRVNANFSYSVKNFANDFRLQLLGEKAEYE